MPSPLGTLRTARPPRGPKRPALPVALLLAVSSSGCLEYGQERQGGVDIFVQNPVERIDVLVVVDNSSSMGPHQEALGSNFEAFISWFIEGDVDYQIAVTTTDDGNDPTVVDPARGRFVGALITPDMRLDTATAEFRRQVNVGVDGSGVEAGLHAAYLALTDAGLTAQIAEFLRYDADLSIVFVSDEEDNSPWPVNDYINAFFELKGHRHRDVFNASALTLTDERTCTPNEALYGSPGTRYVDAAIQTQGLSGNLCDSDFEQIVRDLSLANGRRKDTFFLSDEPDAQTLEVTLETDGVAEALPCEAGAWTYERVPSATGSRPGLVFVRGQTPPPGSRLTVRYLFGSGSVAPFCPAGA